MGDFVVGDILLCLHPQRRVLEQAPRRSRVGAARTWQRLAAGTDFTLWVQHQQQQQSPHDNEDSDASDNPISGAAQTPWRGYDLLTAATPTWQHWLLCDWVPRSVRQAYFDNDVPTQPDNDEQPLPPSNGQFLLLAHHVPSGRFFAATDRFGTLHAYVATTTTSTASSRNNAGLVLGTFSAAVAHHFDDAHGSSTTKLDALGIASFACFGFYLGERTGYEHVRILRPGRLFALERAVQPAAAQELQRTGQWRYEPDWQRDVPDTVAALDDTLRRTVEEHVAGAAPGRIALPLSGGLDSRTLLAALTRSAEDPFAPDDAAKRLWCYAYDYAGMRLETGIARRLAKRRGAAFDAYTVEPYLFALMPWLGPVLEGAQDVTQCRQAAVLAHLREHADVLVAGHWGDVWLDGAWPRTTSSSNGNGAATVVAADDDATLARMLLRKALKPGHEWLLANLVAPLIREAYGATAEPLGMLEEAMREEVARIPPLPDAQARLKAAKTETWSFRWTLASLRCYRMATRLSLPFYDSRLADFFATVPSEWMHGRGLQIAYLKQTAPDLAALPWQATHTSLFAPQPQPRLQRLAQAGLRRAWRRITKQHPVVQRNWEVQLLPHLGRDRLNQALLNATPNNRLHDLVPPTQIRTLLNNFHNTPAREQAHAVTMLLTMQDWLANR